MSRIRRLAVALVLLPGMVACRESRQAKAPPEGAVRKEPGVRIEYIAHASFLIRSPGGTEILIDPYASRVWLGYDFPEGIHPDAVLITHPHYDHDAGRFRGKPFPWGDDVAVVDGPGQFRIGDFTVVGVKGKHADPYGKEFGQRNTVMVLETAGVRIAHLGDNGPPTPELARAIGTVDVLMMPADALHHILSEDATRAWIDALQPRIVIPMHYRLPDLEQDPEAPKGLGDLEPWLQGRANVRRLDGNATVIRASELPAERTILVFRHSPLVTRPR